MRKILSLFIALFVVVGLSGAVALAQDLPTIEIPINTIIRKPASTQVPLVSEDVPEQYIGYICTANAVAKNQSSVHPGNDLIVSSNGTSVTMYDVERAAGISTPAVGILELGPTVDVTLSMGKDAVFSGGMVVELDCEKPEEPVYECTSLTAVVDPSNDKSYTFTTATKLSDDVTIEKYVYDFGVDGESAVTTDKDTITKVYGEAGTYNIGVDVYFSVIEEEKIDSCSTTVTIDEVPEVPPETPEEPQVLPVTGPAAAIAGIFGASSLGYGAYSFKASRTSLRNKILGKD